MSKVRCNVPYLAGKAEIHVAPKRNKPTREEVSATRKKKERLGSTVVKHYRELLLEKRRELLNNVNLIEGEALKKSRIEASGDLSSVPIHMADLATDTYEQEFSLGLMDGERKLLREIDEALDRIEKGIFGICLGTGKIISRPRLDAQPWARYCVEYAQKLEKSSARYNR